MNKYKILSLNVAKPSLYHYNGKEVWSGINKQPVQSPVFLHTTGFEGDGQADTIHHGGVDKAVNVYSHTRYPFWEEKFGRSLSYASFGENLTIDGGVEAEICIGDQFQLGEAIVEVSQPRQPCFKLSMFHQLPDLMNQVIASGFTGFYFRVLQPGYVSSSDTLTQIFAHPAAFSIDRANHVMLDKKVQDLQASEQLLSIEVLSASWRDMLSKRLTR